VPAERKASSVKGEGLDRLPSGRVRARYRDAAGKQHSETFDTVAEAKAWRGAQIDAVARRVDVAPNTKTTVAQYARQHVAALNYRPATRRTAETRLRALERTPLGSLRLVDVRTSHVRAWASDMERQHAASTAAKHLSWLRSVLSAAVEDRLIGANPATASVKVKRRKRAEVEPLTVRQVVALADAVPGRYRAAVLLCAGTGLRLGELLGVRVDAVDFLRREVRVTTQLDRVAQEVAPLKTDDSARTLPLSAHLVEVLAAHLAAYGPGPDGLLFGSTTGRTLRHDETQRQIARAVKVAGLPDGTSALDLRHHFASVLLAANVDVFKVAAAMGHTTPRLVISTYGHLIKDGGVQVRGAVDAAWSVTPVSRAAHL
jgi:integrase